MLPRFRNILSLVIIYCVFNWGIGFSGTVALAGINGVDGDFFTDSELIISGIGFGSHADYGGGDNFLNYIFENCEAGKITKDPKWSVDGGGGFAKIQTTENRSGSNYNLFNERRASTETYANAFGETVTTPYRYGIKSNVKNVAPVHRYFYSMWVMFSENFGLVQDTTDGSGAKIAMNTPFDSGDYKDYFSVGASSDLGEVHISSNTENGDLSVKAGALNYFVPYGTWHRIDTYVSIPDATTGFYDEVTWWIDGRRIRTTKQSGGYLLPNPEDVHKLGMISFMGYMYNGKDIPFYIRTDDFYLDFTQARVEISDSSIWDDTQATHKEIQLPLKWTDSSITIRVNRGAFQDSQSLYLYVIKEDGTPVNNEGIALSKVPAPTPQPVKEFDVVK